ncbi:hypothetical protein GCM10022221_56820 [Actinocorallia aurea]
MVGTGAAEVAGGFVGAAVGGFVGVGGFVDVGVLVGVTVFVGVFDGDLVGVSSGFFVGVFVGDADGPSDGGAGAADSDGLGEPEALEVSLSVVSAGIMISAPITMKIAAMIALTGCIQRLP